MSEKKKWVWRTPKWVPGHIEQYLNDPEAAHMWDSTEAGGPGPVPSLLLTTKGRKTGDPHHAPLVYGKVEGGYAVIGSKGGWPDDPGWYLNLKANPICEIRVAGDHFKAKMRLLSGAERKDVWKKMAKIYPPYDEYAARSEREFPVIVFEPIEKM